MLFSVLPMKQGTERQTVTDLTSLTVDSALGASVKHISECDLQIEQK